MECRTTSLTHAQRWILADVDAGKIPLEEVFARGEELLRERMGPPAVADSPVAGSPPPPHWDFDSRKERRE
jgi:hypothetical protein